MIGRLILFLGAASLLVAACSSFVKLAAPNPIPRTLAVGPTQADAAPAAVNAAGRALAVGNVQAPICQASETCAALNAEQIPLSCVKKVPYTNVLVPVGTTFEVLDQSGSFMCLDTGVVVNGEEVLTCHGTPLFSFQLRLTNAACSGSSLATGTGQCDNDYGYDSAQKCCAPSSTALAGSAVVTVNLAACP
jgi:hypothetical protein